MIACLIWLKLTASGQADRLGNQRIPLQPNKAHGEVWWSKGV